MTTPTFIAHVVIGRIAIAALCIMPMSLLPAANSTLCAIAQQTDSVARQDATQIQPSAIVLEPSGLPEKFVPEALLPSGALVHLRINSTGQLLEDASAMATPFIPEEALGPRARVALEQPNPLLALIGLQSTGQPFSIEMLSELSGIDSARPATLSFYLLPPDQGFVVCLPVFDLNRVSALLNNLLGPRVRTEKVQLQGGFAQKIETGDMTMFVLASADTVCVCGSTAIADAILNSPAEANLSESQLIADTLERHEDDDLWLVIDNTPVKGLLPTLEPFETLPPVLVERLRADILAEIDPLGIGIDQPSAAVTIRHSRRGAAA